MALESWPDTDLCDDCVYFIAYGTLGDASATNHGPATVADYEHAELMRNLLGVDPSFFDSSDDIDGSFSHSGCEACGKTGCHVYTGTLTYDTRSKQP